MNRGIMIAIIALSLCAILGAYVAFSILSTTTTVSNTANIEGVGVGVYSDSACTVPLTSYAWGTLQVPSTNNLTAYLKTTGNVPITLSMATGAWSPSGIASYIRVAWNRQGQIMVVGASGVIAMISLSINSTLPSTYFGKTFTFNMTITGTG
jgi:hypothetical protein